MSRFKRCDIVTSSRVYTREEYPHTHAVTGDFFTDNGHVILSQVRGKYFPSHTYRDTMSQCHTSHDGGAL